MEKFLEKLFDLKRIPTKLIFVLWLSSALILFVPQTILSKLNLKEFLTEYGKFIGITFLISSAFLVVTIVNHFSSKISRRKIINQTKTSILKEIKYLGFHEKALLREFYINGKDTLQLPFDNDTVVGLVNKHILYQASSTGFTYLHGVYFTYAITEFFLSVGVPTNRNCQPSKIISNTIHSTDSRPFAIPGFIQSPCLKSQHPQIKSATHL